MSAHFHSVLIVRLIDARYFLDSPNGTDLLTVHDRVPNDRHSRHECTSTVTITDDPSNFIGYPTGLSPISANAENIVPDTCISLRCSPGWTEEHTSRCDWFNECVLHASSWKVNKSYVELCTSRSLQHSKESLIHCTTLDDRAHAAILSSDA
jgi:hypothetical protein